MSWIKLQTSLPKSAKLLVLAETLGCCEREALGIAMEWFCWIDEQCTDACTGLTGALLDRVMNCQGLCEALEACGWVERDEQGIVLVVDFDQHNGDSAKKRAMSAKRQADFKRRGGNASSVTKKGNASSVTCENEAENKKMLCNEHVTQENDEKANQSCAKSNAKSVTQVTQSALPREEYNMNNIVCRLSNADNACDAEPARTPFEEGTGYEAWLAAVCQAHPSARKSRVLQTDVAEAAKAAYERCPEAAERAELLEAYFAGRQQEDRNRLAFYRPTGQRRFFSDLEDVICHAERWAKEFGWKSKAARSAQKAAEQAGQGKYTQTSQKAREGGKERQQQGMASEEQVADFHAALREGKIWS